MKAILTLLVLAISACGSDSRGEVQTGDFETEYIFSHYESTADTQCDNDKKPGETHTINWTIYEGSGMYQIDAYNDSGRVVYATSNDGYTFKGSAAVFILNCMFHTGWEINLEYGDEPGFIGTENDTLTLSCATGSCSEIWDLVGTAN